MGNSPQLMALSSPALAERLNGWLAMIAFDVVVVSYALTGQIIPGIFWRRHKLKNNYYVIYSLKQKIISRHNERKRWNAKRPLGNGWHPCCYWNLHVHWSNYPWHFLRLWKWTLSNLWSNLFKGSINDLTNLLFKELKNGNWCIISNIHIYWDYYPGWIGMDHEKSIRFL